MLLESRDLKPWRVASWLVMASVGIHAVQELLGRKTTRVTLRYAHLAPQHQLEAAQRLCDTGHALNEPTDTRTDTEGFWTLEAGSVRSN